MKDEERPATPEEEAQAEALARALEGGDGARLDETDRAAVGLVGLMRAAGAAPLGELRARGIAREAFARATPARAGRRWGRRIALSWGLSFAAAVVIGLSLRATSPALPERLCSRSAGLLLPGPFPEAQTEAERLDVVAADRLVAFRELRLRAVARGR